MDYSKIIVERRGAIAKITLNRPEVLNAMDAELLVELQSALEELDRDDNINVAIVTGAGRAFSAGRDMKAIRAGTRPPGLPFYRSFERFSKPVIAAVNGHCFTGAMEMLNWIDLVIASENAVFSETHARYGLVPRGGETQMLPRVIGARKAKELMWTCDRISAAEAERIGLVNKVVPADKLEEAAFEMANKILQNIPKCIRIMKRLINDGAKVELETGIKMEIDAFEPDVATPEERNRRLGAVLDKHPEK